MSDEIKMGTNSVYPKHEFVDFDDCIIKYSYWVVARVSFRHQCVPYNYTTAGRVDLDHKFNSKDIDNCAQLFRDDITREYSSAENIQVVITFFGLLENE